MARIRTIKPGSQTIRAHDTLVDCFFNTVADPEGEVLLHLSTFGSDHRKSAPKSSQSIQLDATMAAKLIAVIYKTFPDIDRADTSHE